MTHATGSWYQRLGENEYVRLLHLPFTFCVLSFALMGALFSPDIHLDRLLLSAAALFFGLGLGAHYVDETRGRPWRTRIPTKVLYIVALTGLIIGISIGVYLSYTVSPWFLLFVFVETFFAVAYNSELFSGRLHNSLVFGLSWGSLVFLGSFYLNALTITPSALSASIVIGLYSIVILKLYEGVKKAETRTLSWSILKLLLLLVYLSASSWTIIRLLGI